MRFKDRCAVVTGAASGIGRETARRLSSEGCSVIVADCNGEAAEQAALELPFNASAFALDVANEAQWIELMSFATQQYGGLDILVNCAGIGISGDVEEMTLEQWNNMVSVNLTGVFLGCKQAIRTMKTQRADASIINISSVGGLVGGEDIAGYCATKGGVTLLTKSLALYCAGKGYNIRCNSVHPGYVDTEMLDPVAAAFDSREQMLAGMASLVPLGRVAKPADIAGAVAFLASDDAAMVTGHQMLVDGGQLAGIPARHTQ